MTCHVTNINNQNREASAYQRYDIQQVARWIGQILPFSLLLLVVFIRQHFQATAWHQEIIAERSEANGFHLPTVICSDANAISQNDILLLSNKKFGESKELPTAYAFALVEHRQQDKRRLRLYLNMLPLVCEVQKYLYVLKICSLSTILREYVALRSICSLPFKDLILTALDIDSKTEDCAWKILGGTLSSQC